MATVAEAVRQIVELTGLPHSTVSYTARYLREAGLLPAGARGGGKGAAHVNDRHLATLLLGIISTTTTTRSPETVKLYGTFKAIRVEGEMRKIHSVPLRRFITEHAAEGVNTINQKISFFMPQIPFLSVISALITAFREGRLDSLSSLFTLTVYHYAEKASIESPMDGGEKWIQWFGPTKGGRPSTIHARRDADHPVLITATIEGGILRDLAELGTEASERTT